ncbi:MAG: protease modulator HflC [Spirochaetales bacterium]|nr:protease modulator HflC [Spirochaetales bacterium]
MPVKKILFFICIIVTLAVVILCFSVFTVKEYEFVIITQFGKPVRILDDAGLYFKLPAFLNTINRFDKRINLFQTQPIQLLLGDKNPIIPVCYVCWKISDPLIFFKSLTFADTAIQKLGDIVNSQLGSELGEYTIENIINVHPEKVKLKEIEEKILKESNKKITGRYGIEIIQVGIRRLEYPSIVAESVYNRMRAEREKEAKRYRAEGKEEASRIEAETDREVAEILAEAYKQSEIIKGEGDRKALKTYAEAYSHDPDFFEFLKSLDTCSEVLKNKSTLILSTDSELLKYLNYTENNE